MKWFFIIFTLFFCLFGVVVFWTMIQEKTLLKHRLEQQKKDGYQRLKISWQREWRQWIGKIYHSQDGAIQKKFPSIQHWFRWNARGKPVFPPPFKRKFLSPSPQNYKKYGEFLISMDGAQRAYWEEKNLNKAQGLLEKLIEQHSEAYVANGLNLLASIKVKLGKPKEAQNLYDRILNHYLGIRHPSGIPLSIYAYFQSISLLQKEKKLLKARNLAYRFQIYFLTNPWGLLSGELRPFLRKNTRIIRGFSPSLAQKKQMDQARWIYRIRQKYPGRKEGIHIFPKKILVFYSSTLAIIFDKKKLFQEKITPFFRRLSRQNHWKISWGNKISPPTPPDKTFTPLPLFPCFRYNLQIPAIEKSSQLFWRSLLTWGGAWMMAGVVFFLSFGMAYKNWKREARLVELKSEFLNIVSHELKTPLTSIALFAEMLAQGDLPPSSVKEYATLIGQETKRLERLIANILTFSRLRAGRISMVCQVQSLGEIVDYTIYLCREGLGKRKVRVEIPENFTLFCHRDSLIQILVNLLSNALKYTDSKDDICISASLEDGWAKIIFSDKGQGIPAEERERIFQKFYRGLASQPKDGVGLGLLIARSLAVEMGGTLELGPSDRGATFLLTLKADMGEGG